MAVGGGLTNVEAWRTRIPRYRLEGAKCGACGRIHYPPLKACPYCGSRELSPIQLPRQGRLLGFTVLYSVEEGGRGEAPTIVGLVDLGVAKVVAEIVDVADSGQLKIGTPVEAVFRRIHEEDEEGVIVYGVKFRPKPGGRENG